MKEEPNEEQQKEHARRQKEAAQRTLDDQARKRGETVKPLVNTMLTDPAHIGKHAQEPHLDEKTVNKLRDQHHVDGGIQTEDVSVEGADGKKEKVGEVVTNPETTVPGASAPDGNRAANQAAEAAGTDAGKAAKDEGKTAKGNGKPHNKGSRKS